MAVHDGSLCQSCLLVKDIYTGLGSLVGFLCILPGECVFYMAHVVCFPVSHLRCHPEASSFLYLADPRASSLLGAAGYLPQVAS